MSCEVLFFTCLLCCKAARPTSSRPNLCLSGDQMDSHQRFVWRCVLPGGCVTHSTSKHVLTGSKPASNRDDTKTFHHNAGKEKCCCLLLLTHLAEVPKMVSRWRDYHTSNLYDTAHPHDVSSSNSHGTAPHTSNVRYARRPSLQPTTAFHGTAPHMQHV